MVIPVLILSSITTTQAQYDYNWAVGFRVGEPVGFDILVDGTVPTGNIIPNKNIDLLFV